MAYTFTQKTASGNLNNFGNLVVDSAHVGLTGVVGAGPQTVDISGTPIVSPATISNSAVTTLTIPLNAVQVTFLAASNTVNISESVAAVTSHYFTIPVGEPVVVDVSRTSVLYLEANSAPATLSFYFNVI
jgi:hypothetical protein